MTSEPLDFERSGPRGGRSKAREIRERWGLTPTRYHQLLVRAVDSPDALAYDPVLVRRLRRLRDAAQARAPGRAAWAIRPARVGWAGTNPRRAGAIYLSVAASTLRFAIIVALAVGGVLLINQAFPEAQGAAAPARCRTAAPSSPNRLPRRRPRPTEPDPVPSPTVAGTRIAVFNGAGVSGLAGDTLTALIDEYGYEEAQPVDDAPATVDVTTIYYRSADDKVEAEFLANDFFGDLDDVRVAKLQAGSDVDRAVQVAIYLGNDYADLVA